MWVVFLVCSFIQSLSPLLPPSSSPMSVLSGNWPQAIWIRCILRKLNWIKSEIVSFNHFVKILIFTRFNWNVDEFKCWWILLTSSYVHARLRDPDDCDNHTYVHTTKHSQDFRNVVKYFLCVEISWIFKAKKRFKIQIFANSFLSTVISIQLFLFYVSSFVWMYFYRQIYAIASISKHKLERKKPLSKQRAVWLTWNENRREFCLY